MLIEEVEQQFSVAVPPGYFGRISAIYRMAVQLADLLWTNDRTSEERFRRSWADKQLSALADQSGVRAGNAKLVSLPATSEFRSSRIYKELRDLTNYWPGRRVDKGSLISSLGDQDAIYDLFVCLQLEAEFVALSRWLGKAFRVHCMRSGHLVMDYVEKNVEQLVSHYMEEIEQISPPGKVLIAGICQGGTIAHVIASRLRQRGEDIPPLVCIEQARPLPFDGNVAFFYSEEDPLNPKNKGGFAKFDELYRDRYSVDFVPGPHGIAADELQARILATKLQYRLAYLSIADNGTRAPRIVQGVRSVSISARLLIRMLRLRVVRSLPPRLLEAIRNARR